MFRTTALAMFIIAFLNPRASLGAQEQLDQDEVGRLRLALYLTDSTQAHLARFAASSRSSDLIGAVRFASVARAMYPRSVESEDANVRGARDFVAEVSGTLGARLIDLLVRDGGRIDQRTVGNPLAVAAGMTSTQVRLALESLPRQ